MKTQQLSNLRRTLLQLKIELGKRIESIDKVIKEIDSFQDTNEKRCNKCFGRDLRILMNNNYFCKSCGYDTRKK